MIQVFLTDGNQRSTLAAVRSLGRKGIMVTVGEHKIPCLASRSRHCHRAVQYPNPEHRSADFIASLAKNLDSHQYDLTIPMTDLTNFLVAQNRDYLSALTTLPVPRWDTYCQVVDKGNVVKLAMELGIPVPKTYFIEDKNQLKYLASDLPYPIVIKPRFSVVKTMTGWKKASVSYAHGKEELIKQLESWDESIPLPLLQERVKGWGCGVFLLTRRGEERAAFFHRRIHEKPPSGGVSVLRESTAPDKFMKDYAASILKSLDWHGVAMVEFKHDIADKQPKLMEINPRFWGSLQLAIDAGVDFPRLFTELILDGDIQPVSSYKIGIRSRWLLGDLDHLIARLLKSKQKLKIPEDSPSRLRVMRDFFDFFRRDTKLEVFDRNDPKPAVYELAEYLRLAIQGFASRRVDR